MNSRRLRIHQNNQQIQERHRTSARQTTCSKFTSLTFSRHPRARLRAFSSTASANLSRKSLALGHSEFTSSRSLTSPHDSQLD